MDELKPCPFCGGEAIHGDEHGEPMIRVNHKRGCFLGTLAICNNDEAFKAWNRRVDDETCELELTWGGQTNAHVRTYECSRCGKSCDNIWGEDYEFCPYCGRRVEYADE